MLFGQIYYWWENQRREYAEDVVWYFLVYSDSSEFKPTYIDRFEDHARFAFYAFLRPSCDNSEK